MQLQALFDKLLEDREVHLRLDKKSAEIMRVMLSKRWNRYKGEMDAVGILDEELATFVLSKQWDKTTGVASFYIRPQAKREQTEYELIEPMAAPAKQS